MAVTKIHPIKSTLKKALDYIENPDKTEDKMLVSSFGCSYETADIEFEMLLAQAIQKGNNLGHHLIQSFAPGEATPEQAHEIGKQLADEVLQGKYSYVLTTHIDKGHVHNHLIFCAVDMVNHRKYNSNRQSYAYSGAPVTGCAGKTVCPWYSPAGIRARAMRNGMPGARARAGKPN